MPKSIKQKIKAVYAKAKTKRAKEYKKLGLKPIGKEGLEFFMTDKERHQLHKLKSTMPDFAAAAKQVRAKVKLKLRSRIPV